MNREYLSFQRIKDGIRRCTRIVYSPDSHDVIALRRNGLIWIVECEAGDREELRGSRIILNDDEARGLIEAMERVLSDGSAS